MHPADLQTSQRAAHDWIERSRSPRTGGARAYYTPLRGWSRTHPEVTGCLLPTVTREGNERLARSFGEFLLDIQLPDGSWRAGTWSSRKDAPRNPMSAAQIARGLCSLHVRTGEPEWLEAAARAGQWLCRSADVATTAFHTQVAWALLELWPLTGETEFRETAIRILDVIRSRRTILGAFTTWGFGGSDAAFTHTIGYTLRGFLESARLLDAWPRYGKPVVVALRRLAEDALAAGGKLPGAYDATWRSDSRYSCLSGSAQIALCLLTAYPSTRNRRFVLAGHAIIEEICRRQRLTHRIAGIRGAIPGSHPLWGRYMRGRYPTWSAKYLCDAIELLFALDQDVVFDQPEATRAKSSQLAFTMT